MINLSVKAHKFLLFYQGLELSYKKEVLGMAFFAELAQQVVLADEGCDLTILRPITRE